MEKLTVSPRVIFGVSGIQPRGGRRETSDHRPSAMGRRRQHCKGLFGLKARESFRSHQRLNLEENPTLVEPEAQVPQYQHDRASLRHRGQRADELETPAEGADP